MFKYLKNILNRKVLETTQPAATDEILATISGQGRKTKYIIVRKQNKSESSNLAEKPQMKKNG